MQRKSSGFTLVELLTVICIIAVLIAMLCPALVRSRDTLRQVQCASNMRSIGQAFLLYTADNSGQMPITTVQQVVSYNWVFWEPGRDINQSALAPFLAYRDDALRDLFRCPAQPVENQEGHDGGQPYPLTYTLNGFNDLYPTMRFQNIRKPATKILLYDENANSDDDTFWWTTPRDTLAGRHGGRTMQTASPNENTTTAELRFGNVTYFDGHVDLADNDMCHTAELNDPSVP